MEFNWIFDSSFLMDHVDHFLPLFQWLVVSKFGSKLQFKPEPAWTEPKVWFKVQQNGWTEPKVQFGVQAMREEFKPEPNLEWQYTKNTLKIKKSLWFQYNFGTNYLLDVICYWLEGKPLPEKVFRLYQQILHNVWFLQNMHQCHYTTMKITFYEASNLEM